MSRSGYTEDGDYDRWDLIRYRGAVKSAIRGKRGQKLLQDIADALDAMTEKRLIAHDLVKEGQYCTLGVIGAARGVPLETIDPEDAETVAGTFGIATALAREIVFENDEGSYAMETPEQRWQRMRKWVAGWLAKDTSPQPTEELSPREALR